MSPQPAPAERRRRDERRRVDRRRDTPEFSATLTEESLFDAMGAGLDGAAPVAEEPVGVGERSEHPDWGATSLPADSPYLAREARRIVGAGESGFERMYRIFVGARAALGLALLGAQIVGLAVGSRTAAGGLISLAYAAQALTLWILPRFHRRAGGAPAPVRLSRRQWVATIGIDLLAFSALHLLAASATFNYTPLLVLPALMAGVLTPRVPAMATAAAASLMLLAGAWQASLGGADPASALVPSGLTGIGLFVITLLAGELAARLAREEQTARGSLELARQQAQLNRLVIEEMADGVLVVDRRARVRAANPAARRLLAAQGMGAPAPFQLQDQTAWRELAERVTSAFESLTWPEGARDVQLPFAAGHSRSLRLRARFTRPRTSGGSAAGEVFCVLFLEDLRSVQARNRQEKLAAMGRVSAGYRRRATDADRDGG
jgi:two-component system sensor histidine kinase PilS (NtrC family)